MNNITSKKYISLSIWLSLSISILVHFSRVFDEIISHSNAQDSIFHYIFNILTELFITFIICFFLFGVNFYILKPFQTQKKNKLFTYLFSLLVSFTIVVILSHFLFEIKTLIFPRVDKEKNESVFIFKDFFVALVVIISVYFIRLVYQNQQNKLEIQNLKIENLQRQFEALKNQVSPHFLFNSLNSLKTLIRETPDIAQEYLNHLSSVLRYTLQANENKLVSLNNELQFVDSYFFLVKMRFSNNINLIKNINPNILEYKIPPLALQILLENSIKHNEISKRNPLEISIQSTDNNSMLVTNNINKKYAPEPGTGLGLANLTSQYIILCGKEIAIKSNETTFTVEIPLIKQ